MSNKKRNHQRTAPQNNNTITEVFYCIVVDGVNKKEYSLSYLISKGLIGKTLVRAYMEAQLKKAWALFPQAADIQVKQDNRVYQQISAQIAPHTDLQSIAAPSQQLN